MHRRDFLAALTAGATATGLAGYVSADTFSSTEDPWRVSFQAALADKPWLLGYANAAQAEFAAPAKIQGTWPAELTGTLYRNGPAQHEIAGVRYHHWFAGDGMMQAFHMQQGQVRHQAKLVETRKLQEERAAGRPLYPGFASIPPNPAPLRGPDSVNVANISVLPHHGKLFALWEAGSPYEIDPITLATKGRHVFSAETDGVPFSAHPRIEPDGTLWNFGYLSSASLLVFWHINRQGKLQKAHTLRVDPMTMPHDFVVTRNHLVILLPPLHYQPGSNTSFLDSHKWQPQDPTRILVVDKNDFTKVQRFELPAQWVFHFGNAWEDQSGIIRFDGARADDPSIMFDTFREIMRGRVVPVAGATQYLYCMTSRNNQPAPHASLTSVSRFDFASEQLSTFQYPKHKIPEEHIFVPRPDAGRENQGWLLGTALDYKHKATELNVFDAEAVDAGPIATATLPYALPLGLHGKFSAAPS